MASYTVECACLTVYLWNQGQRRDRPLELECFLGLRHFRATSKPPLAIPTSILRPHGEHRCCNCRVRQQ